MSTPLELRNAPFHVFQIKDIMTGAEIMQGRVYQWNPESINAKDANSYTFVPPIMVRPGMMILIKD